MQTMPDLPDDPHEARAVVRKMLMDEVIPLMKASGLKYTWAQFRVSAMDDKNDGDVAINFHPCSDEQIQAMTKAIWAHGWKQGSISDALHVRKGPLDIQWGKGYDGCTFEMSTDYVSQHLAMTDDDSVPELAAFKGKGPALKSCSSCGHWTWRKHDSSRLGQENLLRHLRILGRFAWPPLRVFFRVS